jgi:polar amino acid transport system permease protein
MNFDISLIASRLPELAQGLGVTVLMWVAGTVGATLLGFGVAVIRRYGARPLAVLLSAYVEVIRGTPFLIQLFLIYFGGPYLGLALDPVPAGLLGITLYGAAYFAEIFRAGFSAVPQGHVEAAESLGFTRRQVIFRVLIPEMTMLVLPAAVNMTIVLAKDTAVLSIITVPEVTMVISAIGSEYYAFVESLFLLALFYWALVEGCGKLGRLAESKLSKYRFAAS